MLGRINRKGWNNIIVSAVLIIVSLSAIFIIGVYIYNLSKPEFSPAFSCLEMQLEQSMRIERACYNNETGDVEVRVFRREDGFELRNIYFNLNYESKSSRWCCGEGCLECDVLEEGKSKNYYVSGSGDEKSIELSVFDCEISEREIGACEQ